MTGALRPWASVLSLALLAGLAASVAAHFAMPTGMPAARVIRNCEAYTREHPEDVAGWHVLARAHAYTFIFATRRLESYGTRQGQPPSIAGERAWRWPDTGDHPMLVAERVRHLDASIHAYRQAIALQPQRADLHLGLAYIVERGVTFAEVAALPEPVPAADAATADRIRTEFDAPDPSSAERLINLLPASAPMAAARLGDPDPAVAALARAVLMEHWRRVALAEYLLAYSISVGPDLQLERQPDFGGAESLVSFEAGHAWRRLVCAQARISKQERAQIAQIEADMATLAAKPQYFIITPIIFDLAAPRPLEELLDPQAHVCFDLDGNGVSETWPWLRPSTALLVWRPDDTTPITSGRQLFGSVTWWMFFPDGYLALNTLDDDRDGLLSGDELTGLAAWFDINGNGVSEPGEVHTLEEVGVAALATDVTGHSGAAPMNARGLILQNGAILPTYDWVTAPIDDAPAENPQ